MLLRGVVAQFEEIAGSLETSTPPLEPVRLVAAPARIPRITSTHEFLATVEQCRDLCLENQLDHHLDRLEVILNRFYAL